MVVRLKGGAPYLFGRGAEEASYLARHGICVEVIPGVTAGIAAPATAGIAVTRRHMASSVIFVTGHEDQEAVQRRVKPFIDQLVDRQADDVLLVGHGATIWACFEVIKGLGEIVGELPELNNGWNCSLSTYDVDAQLRTQILQLFDVSHMPPECVSSNGEYLVPRDHS